MTANAAPRVDGLLLIDKPAGPTSRAVLDDLEPRLDAGALGHAGTLDPLASGLLTVLVGRARRLQDFFTAKSKSYRAVVRFGRTTDTDDGEAPERAGPAPVPECDDATRRALLAGFVGERMQRPPAFSAVRVHGRRAHRVARGGGDVDVPARLVRIDAIDLVGAEGPDWTIDVACGSGTYIRSLARDLGAALGCGAYLFRLRRTSGGAFRVEDALPPGRATIADVMPLSDTLADEPKLELDAVAAKRLKDGLPITAPTPAASGFAWFEGRPCFRLKVVGSGLARAAVMFVDPFGP